ncbi:MAG: hypothetical protein OEM97_04100 [Acidimicrobiia bacterium]|nr:hypothetical protein [Acidimicrobiia bacterium]
MGFDAIPPGVFATIGVAGLGGLIGGALTSARKNLFVSILIGAIVGLSAGTVLRLLGVPTLVDVEGYPLVWSALAGLVSAYLVSTTTT